MKDKTVIENYKSIRAIEQSQPQPLKPDEISHIKSVINDAWENRSSIIRETRSLSEIVDAIESDKSKSRERKDLELRIAKIADRIRDHLEPNSEPLHLESEKPQADIDNVIPFRKQKQIARERLN
jgi:hypothetical protein